MQNDIIKQIILKFKSEGSEQAKKAAESIGKAFNARDTERFLRNLEQVQQKFGRAGQGMSTELKKVTDYFKELNNQHFQKAERNLDRMGRLIKTQIENLEKLKREGAAAEQIAAREATLQKATRRFEEMANSTPYPQTLRGYIIDQVPGIQQARQIGRMLPPGLARAAGIGLGVGGALSVAGMIADSYKDFRISEIQNRQLVANTLKQQALDYYQGDMGRAVLLTPERRAEIAKTAGRLNLASDVSTGLKGILGAGLTIAGGALGSLAGPLGTIGGAMLGSQIGSMLGLGGAGDTLRAGKYFFGGGRAAERTANLQRAEAEAQAKTFDVELYKEFERNRALRYEYQRQLGLGDDAARAMRRTFREQGFLNESEMASTALAFRRFGSGQAIGAATATAAAAREYGLSLGATTGLMQQIGGATRGGISTAADQLKLVMQEAVRVGVRDSGLIEEFAKGTASISEAVGRGMDTSSVAATLGLFGKSGPATDRSLMGMMGGMQSMGAVLGGTTPFMQSLKTAKLLEMAGGDLLKYKMLSGLSDQQLLTMGQDQNMLARLGISQEQATRYQQEMMAARMSTGLGRAQSAQLLNQLRTGKINITDASKILTALDVNTTGLSNEEIVTQLVGMARMSGTLKEGQALEVFQQLPGQGETSLWKGTVGGGTATEAAGALSAITAGATGGAAGKATMAAGEAAQKLDDRVKAIEEGIDPIIETFKKMGGELDKAVTDSNLSGSVGEIATQLTDLATTLKMTVPSIVDSLKKAQSN